ncbi:MAG: hypothetical protein LBT80_07405 [Lactobacillaceae bacterium]|jgi:hypothetical protein|nr:hypothetical protein [Lactobacillaceae bacterium]
MKKQIVKRAGLLLMVTAGLAAGSSKLISDTISSNHDTLKTTRLSVRPETAYVANASINKTTESYIDVPQTALTTNNYPTAEVYNPALAKMGAVLSQSCYSKDLNDDDKPGYTNKDLKILGYDDIQLYNFDLSANDKYNSATNIAYTIAHKTVEIDGKQANSFIVVIRGTPDSKEWNGDFRWSLGDGQDLAKFWENNIYTLGKKVYDTFGEYCLAHSETISPETVNKLFITGHSRGGGTSECLGYLFDKDIEANRGLMSGHSVINANATPISKNDVLVYAIAPTQAYHPGIEENTVDDQPEVKAYKNGAYNNIHSIVNPLDFVPTNPITKWGYQHVGTVHTLFNPKTVTPETYGEFLKTYKNVGSLGVNDTRVLYSAADINAGVGFGDGFEYTTLAARLKHDGSGVHGFATSLHDICPNLIDFTTPEEVGVQISDKKKVNEWFSAEEFFHSYSNAFIGDQPFATPKLKRVVSAVVSNVVQTSEKAQAYKKVLKYLPTSPDGPNVAHHFCTTYIAWLFAAKTN